MLGVGGAHVSDVGEATSQEILEAAIEQGIRFFDTAAMYGDGESEKRFGRLLVPKYRDVAFIMTKSHVRTGPGALAQLEASLRHMQLDHVDLWQMHDIQSPEDVDNRVRDGVVDAFVQAQAQGKTRYIGFTGHTSYKAHLRMLEVLAERGVQATTAQMPINVVDAHYESFVLNVVPRCVQAGIGVLAMKTLAYGRILGQKVGWARNDATLHNIVPEALSLEQALGFVWSLPTSVLISGMTSREQVESNTAMARRTAALSEVERSRLVEAVRPFAGPGVEFYKA
jgi:aryl-alcohol dehydrogenase-like predicted oxidoreductase